MNVKIKLLMLVSLSLLLAACTTSGAIQVGDGIEVYDEPALTPTPATERIPTSISAGIVEQPSPDFTPRFDYYLPLLEDGSSLVGLVQNGNSWQKVSVPYPANTYYSNIDYALATDRLLVWQSLEGVGPGNLAAGLLSMINVATQVQQTIVADNVVAAGWAPNGLDFAYILATPDTYELRWHTANGNDTLLAVDVPHSMRVSPDGRFVAFTRESHYGLETAVPGLYVVNVETGKEIQVSTLDRAGYGGIGSFWKPIWSPDSSQLILYATADDDRAATPHESGYVWAAADGSFSHFLPESAFLAFFDKSSSTPDSVPCLDIPPLFATNRMVLRVGECQPMAMAPEVAATIEFALNAQTGTLQMEQTLTAPLTAKLLVWMVPGESMLLDHDGGVITLSLEG